MVTVMGLDVATVERLIAPVVSGWRGDAPRVRVVGSAAELPEAIRRAPGSAEAEGVYWRGEVYLVASRLRSERRVLEVLAHEAIGHYGIEAVTGPELWGEIGRLVKRMRESGQQGELFAELSRRGYRPEDPAYTREVVAVLAERGTRCTVLDRVEGACRRFLRGLGFRVEWSVAELRGLITRAARHVERAPEAAAAVDLEAAPAMRSDSRFTDTFRRWFGNSRLVHDTGEPQVLYHGTSSDVRAFRISPRGNFGAGIYLATDPDQADAFAYAKESGANILPVFAALQRPFYTTADYNEGVAVDVDSPAVPLIREIYGSQAPAIIGRLRNSPSGHLGLAIRERLLALGHDGIVARYNDGTAEVVAFFPEQVKSAIGNDGGFDPANPSILHSTGRKGFFSALLEAIVRAKDAPRSGTAESWKGWLDGAQRRGLFKKAEREWVGVDAWLERKDGAVRRTDIEAFVRSHGVIVEPLLLVDPGAGGLDVSDALNLWMGDADVDEPETADDWYAIAMDLQSEDLDDLADEAQALGERFAAGEVAGATRYSKFTLPGGERYREVLLRLPATKDRLSAMTRAELGRWYEQEVGYDPTKDDPSISDADLRELVSGMQAELIANGESVNVVSNRYRSPHWEQDNVVAHLRLKDRVAKDGRRVLFVEEMQSDWHQAGRRRGYGTPVEDTPPPGALTFQVNDVTRTITVDLNGTLLGVRMRDPAMTPEAQALEVYRWRQTNGTLANRVPDAPFKGTEEWAMLGFKHAVVDAVSSGATMVAWTTGVQQAERFRLSRYVSEILYRPNPDGTFRVSAQTKEGGLNVHKLLGPSITADALADHVGKDIAARIRDGQGSPTEVATPADPSDGPLALGCKEQGWFSLSGDGLRIGHEGMCGFYDGILVAAVSRWAKQYGARVETVEVSTAIDSQVSEIRWSEDTDGEQHVEWDGGEARFQTESEAERFVESLKNAMTEVHGMEITPAMREAVLSGLPLFSRPTVPESTSGLGAEQLRVIP